MKRAKSKTKKSIFISSKASAEQDLSLCKSVIKAHADFIAAIAAATEKGLRVDCGRDVGTPISVFRPVKPQ